MHLLSLDPSINHMGWAIFEYTDKTIKPINLLHWGTLKTEKFKGLAMADRIIYTIATLEQTLIDLGVMTKTSSSFATIVVEEPQLWGAYKSVASQHSGSLLSLYMLTGALCWWGWMNVTKKVVSIPVSKWKGQLPKEITKRRMEAQWNCTFHTSDEADAVGLGTYFLEQEVI